MEDWHDLTLTEQVLVRRAVAGHQLGNTPQHVNSVLRWTGSPDVPAHRGATVSEQLARVPELAAATLRLVGAGWLTVHRGWYRSDGEQQVSGPELERALADPATWRYGGPVLSVRATAEGNARWEAVAYPTGRRQQPQWAEFDEAEKAVRICATESGGWLTGPYGIFADLPTDLAGEELRAHVAAELAPLLRCVRAGSIEVHHFADPDSEHFAVVPPDELLDAFCDREVRCDDSADRSVGFTCVLIRSPATGLR
ncbi:hypothetical protein [Kitasatospora phosalacinea]|uniref:Uncharacterized protein n=1 Tax=Kitasatospora phosalacinea TaxID=2065 RepID=A0A9W6UQC8_9ACTN|nr:hypothetical protein [Kitasatospora phosalacinea]GLW56022.1 hypothetical protein Kpho01_40330 [Kitasatospora phosalacinea]